MRKESGLFLRSMTTPGRVTIGRPFWIRATAEGNIDPYFFVPWVGRVTPDLPVPARPPPPRQLEGGLQQRSLTAVFGSGLLTQNDFNAFPWHMLFLLGGGHVLGVSVDFRSQGGGLPK